LHCSGDFFDLSRACKSGCIGPLAFAFDDGNRMDAGTLCKPADFFLRFGKIKFAEIEAYENCAITPAGSIVHQGSSVANWSGAPGA
jgi:hypothetical protein